MVSLMHFCAVCGANTVKQKEVCQKHTIHKHYSPYPYYVELIEEAAIAEKKDPKIVPELTGANCTNILAHLNLHEFNSVGQIAKDVGIDLSNMDRFLKVLRKAGYIRTYWRSGKQYAIILVEDTEWEIPRPEVLAGRERPSSHRPPD